jgi:hypothetical protein
MSAAIVRAIVNLRFLMFLSISLHSLLTNVLSAESFTLTIAEDKE